MVRNTKLPALILMLHLTLGMVNGYAGVDNAAGARGEGIGFSFTALADEPFGILYNPAGPAFTRGWQTQLQYYMPSQYGLPGSDESPYGGLFGVNYHDKKLGNVAFAAHQLGSFSDPTDITTTSTANLSYSRLLNNHFAVGAGAKYLFETNGGKRKAFDLDIGVSWRSPYNIALAAVGENLLASKLTPDLPSYSEYLSRKFRMTGAYIIPLTEHMGLFSAGWQMEQTKWESSHNTSLFNFGSEWWIGTNSSISLGIRAGYTFGKATVADIETDYNRWNAGLSLNFDIHGRDLRLDYAIRSYPFESNETLTADNLLSIVYGWGGIPDYRQQKASDKYDFTSYQVREPIHQPVEPVPAPTIEEPISQPAALPEQPAVEPAPVVEITPSIEQEPVVELAPADEPMPETEPAPIVEPTPIVEPIPIAEPAKDEPQLAQIPAIVPQPEIEEIETTPEAIEPPAPPPAKATTPAPEPISFMKLKVETDFTQLNVGTGNRLIFYLRPEGIVNLTAWKLYVFNAKLKDWSNEGADLYAIHKIEGKGIPPLNVVWNGILKNGHFIDSGKYFYVVIGVDKYGQYYQSDWHKFNLK
jgi:hypothetical protein